MSDLEKCYTNYFTSLYGGLIKSLNFYSKTFYMIRILKYLKCHGAEWHLDTVLVDVARTRQVVLSFLRLLAEDDDLFKEENPSFSRGEFLLSCR